MSKIPMSSMIEQRIMESIQNESGGKLLQGLLTEGLRKMVTELVEVEVTEFLGRDHYGSSPEFSVTFNYPLTESVSTSSISCSSSHA